MKRDSFFKLYSNLPIGIRRDIILTTEDGPITWEVAYSEIKEETELGGIILKKLYDLGFLYENNNE